MFEEILDTFLSDQALIVGLVLLYGFNFKSGKGVKWHSIENWQFGGDVLLAIGVLGVLFVSDQFDAQIAWIVRSDSGLFEIIAVACPFEIALAAMVASWLFAFSLVAKLSRDYGPSGSKPEQFFYLNIFQNLAAFAIYILLRVAMSADFWPDLSKMP